ncbi:PTS sugar transporter subunit IIA [Cutibacterium modestum]|uniref:PTS sugar transporter subunit IIA n=1 Tax=Cutibacterium modestum TaxID=2559073 RepID=UPI000F0653AF|nr:PTS sugar transporter subunit IIA [Cutibacterium modestum]MCP2378757.1 PTS transporter subunit IIA-like nitrogen-regulatory protein PtsN [Cutibacterium modestum 31N]
MVAQAEVKSELVRLDVSVNTPEELLTMVGDDLVHRGYVNETFTQAVLAREGAFPTALPTRPDAIAIPHTDREHIVRPFIAPMRLKHAIAWNEMGNPGMRQSVRFVFMLGFVGENGHVGLLQKLLDMVNGHGLLDKLARARTEEEVVNELYGLHE